mgnify:FL=1
MRGEPIVVFGACDRHNLGDLLFPHLARALLPHDEWVVAGLASRDLRAVGGHRVHALAEVAARFGAAPLRALQLGGELLTCSAWQAAVMLLPPELASSTVAWLGPRPATRRPWLRRWLGCDDRAPYLLARGALPQVRRLVVAGVGGVDLARCPPAMRHEVLAKLRDADALSVRDHRTQAALQALGVDATLAPDPAVRVATLCAQPIAHHAQRGEPAALRDAFPDGYVAVQADAGFGDDATLGTLAAQLHAVQSVSGLGVVLWRAGAAPWHDDLVLLQRLAARLPARAVRVFESLHLWDLCALVAGAQAVCASSLHARIVALAHARPRVSLHAPAEPGQARKLRAFVETWDATAGAVVDASGAARALRAALAMPAAALRQAGVAAAAAWDARWRAAWPDDPPVTPARATSPRQRGTGDRRDVQHEVVADRGEAARQRLADARRGAGDESDPAAGGIA